MSSRNNQNTISQGLDWTIIWLYAILVSIGILCIFMVEYRPDTNWFQSFLGGKTNYSKQLIFAGFCAIVAMFILLTDSKLFTAFANLLYGFGILLMLATFVLGKRMGQKVGYRLGVDLICNQPKYVKYLLRLRLQNFYQGRKQISAN